MMVIILQRIKIAVYSSFEFFVAILNFEFGLGFFGLRCFSLNKLEFGHLLERFVCEETDVDVAVF